MEILQNVDSVKDLKKARTVVKGQITKADRLVEDENTSKEILNDRLDMLQEIWDRFQVIQLKIELKTNEEDINNEISYRTEMEDKYYKLKDLIHTRLKQLEHDPTFQQNRTTSNQVLRPLTSAISFTPFQDDESFKNFIRRLEIFMHLQGQGLQPKDKVFTLLHALSPSLHQKVYNLCTPENPLEKSYEELVQILSDYVDPKPSAWALQHTFLSRLQESTETVKVYSAELQKLTMDCDFTCENCERTIANTLLRMQFIRGLKDSDVRARILQEKSILSFNDVVKIATSMELAKDESYQVKLNSSFPVSNVHKIGNQRVERAPRTNGTLKSSAFDKLKGKCFRCGSPDHRANNCKFASEFCRKCKKQGHIAIVCMQTSGTKVHQTELDSNDGCQEETQEIYKIHSKDTDKILVNVLLDAKPVQMELDTGSAISTLPYNTFKKLNINKRMFNTQIQLKTYTGETFKPKGVIFVQCLYNNQGFMGKLYIVDNHLDAIFGRDWVREVKVDLAEIKSIKHETGSSLDELLHKYNDIFEPGIGRIPDQLGHLQLTEEARPVFMKARPIPYSLKQKVDLELDRLENAGVLTKTEHSQWGTPIVPVVKPNGDVRICADYRVTVNKQIQDEHYPIPKIEDIFANMNGGTLFCTLDLKNAYLHLEMDDTSANIQTLSTHKGQYTE